MLTTGEWGNFHNDRSRGLIEQVMTENRIIMNTGSSAHLFGTAIDLILISPSLNAGTSWRTFPSVLSSDHCPTIVTSVGRANNRGVSKIYNYKKISWKEYSRDAIWKDLQRERNLSPDQLLSDFCRRLQSAADTWVPTYKPKKFYSKPWWSSECHKVCRERERLYEI